MMSENKETTNICPTCGTSLVKSTLDGSFKLDGSQTLDGLKYPNCSSTSEDAQ